MRPGVHIDMKAVIDSIYNAWLIGVLIHDPNEKIKNKIQFVLTYLTSVTICNIEDVRTEMTLGC